MAEPTSSGIAAWLLNNLWVLLLAVVGEFWRRGARDKAATDERIRTVEKAASEAREQLGVLRAKMDEAERHRDEDRQAQQRALDKIDNKFRDLHSELHLIRTDWATALNDFRHETTKLLAALMKGDKP